jgi:hypothetical protein
MAASWSSRPRLSKSPPEQTLSKTTLRSNRTRISDLAELATATNAALRQRDPHELHLPQSGRGAEVLEQLPGDSVSSFSLRKMAHSVKQDLPMSRLEVEFRTLSRFNKLAMIVRPVQQECRNAQGLGRQIGCLKLGIPGIELRVAPASRYPCKTTSSKSSPCQLLAASSIQLACTGRVGSMCPIALSHRL